MATTRRRQLSNASTSLTTRHRQSISRSNNTSPPVVSSSNPHLSDAILAPFLTPSFSAASYLNSTLPPLKPRTTTTSRSSPAPSDNALQPVVLGDLAAEAQRLLGQLSVRLESLGKALTEETDKVLRAGPRLGYEVEVLRGEVRNLDETLHDKLEADISVFVPCGLAPESSKPEAKSNGTTPQTNGETAPDTAKPIPQEAEKETDMAKLRTLTLVRTRLDTVKSTFSNAMDWTFPPSEVSVSSGLISVSASEPGSEAASTEEKGQEVSRRLKAEIQELLSRADGVAKARTRISELRQLAEVWKGTAEEKARTRFIDSLERVVDERETEINRRNEEQRVLADSERPLGGNNGNNASSSALGGYGFMGQLGRIRGGI